MHRNWRWTNPNQKEFFHEKKTTFAIQLFNLCHAHIEVFRDRRDRDRRLIWFHEMEINRFCHVVRRVWAEQDAIFHIWFVFPIKNTRILLHAPLTLIPTEKGNRKMALRNRIEMNSLFYCPKRDIFTITPRNWCGNRIKSFSSLLKVLLRWRKKWRIDESAKEPNTFFLL